MGRRAAFLLVMGLVSGCAAPLRTEPAPLEKPLAARAGVVFLIHGIWPDGGWVEGAERAFRKVGLETVPLSYATFVPGYVLGYGTDEPAERLVAFVGALEARHAASGCAVPLRYHSVAFSAGTVVTLKAAERGVRFETAHFGGSPIFCFSRDLAGAVREGRIGSVTNYWSPFDGVVGIVLGSGQFGYHGGGEDERLAIENVPFPYAHLLPPFDESLSDHIARALREAARDAPAHSCFADPEFAAWFRRETDRLARGEGVEPQPPASPPRP